VGVAGRKTAETVSAADGIIEALDLAADERERFEEFEKVGGAGRTPMDPFSVRSAAMAGGHWSLARLLRTWPLLCLPGAQPLVAARCRRRRPTLRPSPPGPTRCCWG
jgi:hypothetical protein